MSDEEEMRYIGYSMSRNKWILIKPANVRADTYEFLNSGATAIVYANIALNKIVKIIRGSEYKTAAEFIAESQQEVKYQSAAARYGFAPQIYHHGFVEKENAPFWQYTLPYYYIVMDYIGEANGWEQIYAEDNPPLFCDFINNFVDKVGFINNEDPYAHFYYNKYINKLIMIDYGRCYECSADKMECKREMAKVLGLTNCFSNGGIMSSFFRKRCFSLPHQFLLLVYQNMSLNLPLSIIQCSLGPVCQQYIQ